jgi:hypothetical protein
MQPTKRKSIELLNILLFVDIVGERNPLRGKGELRENRVNRS